MGWKAGSPLGAAAWVRELRVAPGTVVGEPEGARGVKAEAEGALRRGRAFAERGGDAEGEVDEHREEAGEGAHMDAVLGRVSLVVAGVVGPAYFAIEGLDAVNDLATRMEAGCEAASARGEPGALSKEAGADARVVGAGGGVAEMTPEEESSA